MPFLVPALVLLALAFAGCGGANDDGPTAQELQRAEAGADAEPIPTRKGARGSETSTSAARGVVLARVGTFDRPLGVTAPPGDEERIFVTEQGGRIWVVKRGRRLKSPFLDLTGKTDAGGERGLLGLAFAPDYAKTGRFYVNYTDTNGDTRVVEYRRASADRADPGTARQVLFQDQPEPNHNGGHLAFGPDKLLYIGLGDGGGAGDRHGRRGNAQDLGSLLGKILRIDPREGPNGRRYRIPKDNPFVGRAGARGEIYAYGLRNPWRFSFDRETDDLSIGDVGQSEVEEVDFVRNGKGRGANFGWRPFEGTRRYTSGESAPGHVKPVLSHGHDAGWCSVTGGVVVRDRELPALYGRYVYGDFCKPVIYSAKLKAPRARDVRASRLRVTSLSSFGEDARGRVYAASLAGPVYRLKPR
ncbi:MAG: PQQ-dependent sugar dehydrogenase [Actinomycetota bacterium]|nr:PQQ-dependent sugar dehydrogenase [Actinomycetota bacterium]